MKTARTTKKGQTLSTVFHFEAFKCADVARSWEHSNKSPGMRNKRVFVSLRNLMEPSDVRTVHLFKHMGQWKEDS